MSGFIANTTTTRESRFWGASPNYRFCDDFRFIPIVVAAVRLKGLRPRVSHATCDATRRARSRPGIEEVFWFSWYNTRCATAHASMTNLFTKVFIDMSGQSGANILMKDKFRLIFNLQIKKKNKKKFYQTKLQAKQNKKVLPRIANLAVSIVNCK